MEDGSFSGKINIEESDYIPVKRKHFSLNLNDDRKDPRIDVIKEYILKAPNATIKQLKSALSHFSDYTESEFRSILKEANVDKFNELFPVENEIVAKGIVSIETISKSTAFNEKEISFLKEKIATCNDNRTIYNSYKIAFPNSLREYNFIKDFKYKISKPPSNNVRTLVKNTVTTTSFAKTIRVLYKAGFTPETIHNVKPVLDELIAQNCNQEEINLAIAYLKA